MSEVLDYVITVVLALLPISELRGAIPYAYFRGIPLTVAAPLAILANCMVAPIALAFLASFHKLFYTYWRWYRSFFDRFIANAQRKISVKVNKYGYWGILLFVAVPLPITGAWTGTLGSWILGLDKRKSMVAVFGGVIIAGLIVTALIALGIGIDSVFIKRL